VEELRASINLQSDDFTAKTHRATLITWLVICFGLTISWAIALYIIETEVVKELLSMRVSIEGLASGRLDQDIPYLDQTNEIGAISRALSTLRGVAQEREIQHWVKAAVAGSVERLQSAEDFATFSNRLFSCLSQSIALIYGALYVTDESRKRLTRVGGFALDNPDQAREFALGEGLVGQAAVERRPLLLSTNQEDQLCVATGMGTVTPRTLLFMPVVHQDVVIGVLELAPISSLSERQQALLDALLPVLAFTLGTPAGIAGCTCACFGVHSRNASRHCWMHFCLFWP
jgi:two-component system sensor histidine kinase/response regulator